MKYFQSTRRLIPAAVAALTAAVVLVGCSAPDEPTDPNGTDIPRVTVNFGNSSFVDHSNAIIGIEKGWFEEVGITLAPGPAGSFNDPGNGAAVLQAGTVDIQSSNYQILLPAYAQTKDLKMFAYGDFFIGFALMGASEFTSADEFVEQGLSKKEALRAALEQMRGHTLTWSTDQAVRGFGRTLFNEAGLEMEGIDQQTIPDAQGLQLMIAGRADFQIGGAPTRQALEQTPGFKAIVTAQFLTGMVEPPYETSEALAAVSTNGWATTQQYWEQHEDTVMRMASVAWRISQFIHENPAEAAEIQTPFLNANSGTSLTVDDVQTIYASIDPFIPFDEQGPLWFTEGEPTYEYNMIAAAISQAEANGVLKPGAVTPEDISIAPQVYAKALALKAEADELFAQAEADGTTNATLDKAKRFYEIFDYLDAVRLAKVALSQ